MFFQRDLTSHQPRHSCVSTHIYIYISTYYEPIYLPAYLHVFTYLPIYLSTYLRIYLSTIIYICTSLLIYLSRKNYLSIKYNTLQSETLQNLQMVVSENGGTPNRDFHYFHHPFWGVSPIFGNTQLVAYCRPLPFADKPAALFLLVDGLRNASASEWCAKRFHTHLLPRLSAPWLRFSPFRPWPPENHRNPFFIPRHLFFKDDVIHFFPFDGIFCIVLWGFLQKRIFLTFMANCFLLLGTFFKSMMETEG